MSRYNQYDPYETAHNDSNKNQHLSDNERLDKLEKKVCCLRTDFDKMKYEQAIVETAIGRAIIRGSASLGRCLVSPGQNDQENCENMENCPVNTQVISKSLKTQNAFGKNYELVGKSKRNQKEDGGFFTLG